MQTMAELIWFIYQLDLFLESIILATTYKDKVRAQSNIYKCLTFPWELTWSMKSYEKPTAYNCKSCTI